MHSAELLVLEQSIEPVALQLHAFLKARPGSFRTLGGFPRSSQL